MLRTTVASSRTAIASPKPSCWITEVFSVTNTPNTTTMIAAALVMVPDVIEMPFATAAFVLRPRSRASLMRVRMKTW